MQGKAGFCKGLGKVGVVGEGERRGLEGVKWGEKWGEKGLEWLWDKGLAERKCRRKRGIEGEGGGWWKGDGKGWGVKGVKGDWKMGMISDCDELQENQRKNDPLTVKTPPHPARVPSCLVDAGRQDQQRA